jgi:hypothetical protein
MAVVLNLLIIVRFIVQQVRVFYDISLGEDYTFKSFSYGTGHTLGQGLGLTLSGGFEGRGNGLVAGSCRGTGSRIRVRCL